MQTVVSRGVAVIAHVMKRGREDQYLSLGTFDFMQQTRLVDGSWKHQGGCYGGKLVFEGVTVEHGRDRTCRLGLLLLGDEYVDNLIGSATILAVNWSGETAPIARAAVPFGEHGITQTVIQAKELLEVDEELQVLLGSLDNPESKLGKQAALMTVRDDSPVLVFYPAALEF